MNLLELTTLYNSCMAHLIFIALPASLLPSFGAQLPPSAQALTVAHPATCMARKCGNRLRPNFWWACVSCVQCLGTC